MNQPLTAMPHTMIQPTPAAARGIYRTIFRQLVTSNYWLTGLMLLFLLVLIGTQLFASVRDATTTFGACLEVMFIFGVALGYTTSTLWGPDSRLLVPDYHRRLMRVVTATALLVWLMVPLSYQIGRADHGIYPWVGMVWLWSYGLLSSGFFAGFLLTRRVRLASVVLLSIILMPVLMQAVQPLDHWLFEAYLPYAPVTVLSLLLGPHNWPLYFSQRMAGGWRVRLVKPAAPSETTVRTAGVVEEFLLRSWLPILHTRSRLRREFLLFPPGLVAMLWIPLLAAGVFGLLGSLIDGVTARNIANAMLGLGVLLSVILSHYAVISRTSLGRHALLPGAVHRRQLASWLGWRYFLVVAMGLALYWTPSVLFAFWHGALWADVARYAGPVLLTLINITALQMFFLSGHRRLQGTSRLIVVIAAAIGAEYVAEFSTQTNTDTREWATAVAASLALSLALYLWGAWRCKTMDLGA